MVMYLILSKFMSFAPAPPPPHPPYPPLHPLLSSPPRPCRPQTRCFLGGPRAVAGHGFGWSSLIGQEGLHKEEGVKP